MLQNPSLRGADGASKSCEASYLAGCDGARSEVREKLGIRVMGQTSWPASDLVKQWDVSRFSLNLGVGMAIWKTFYLGLDAILVGDPSPGTNRSD